MGQLSEAPAASRPLGVPQLDRLVLANNPDLRAARAQLGVSRAQIEVAGILPNPQLSGAYPFLISGPGITDSFSGGLTQDIKSLLTYKSKVATAEADANQVNASLLWQEWQTLGKARLLAVQITQGERLRDVIDQTRAALIAKYRLTKQAITEGNTTIATLSPDLVAVGDIEKNRADLQRQIAIGRHQLNALLGLTPEATLALRSPLSLPAAPGHVVKAEAASVAERRPDLIALRFGFASAEAKLRGAVLAQFPNLVLGLTGGRDTSYVGTFGPQATIDLPIFDRNQGQIALATATRE